jgi:hypothetical protein
MLLKVYSNPLIQKLPIATRPKKTQWVVDGNLLTDDFAENKESNNALKNYHYNTSGGFVQNTGHSSIIVYFMQQYLTFGRLYLISWNRTVDFGSFICSNLFSLNCINSKVESKANIAV